MAIKDDNGVVETSAVDEYVPPSKGGRVTFVSKDPNMSFTCWLGNEGVKVTGGYGGWDIVERPRRLSLTQWNGRNPISMDIPLVFDGWQENKSMETSCEVLEKMAGTTSGDYDSPPLVTIASTMVPHTGQKFVITNVTWGEQIRRSTDGDRLRQEAMVSVVRFVDADKVQVSAAQLLRNKKKKRVAKKKKKK